MRLPHSLPVPGFRAPGTGSQRRSSTRCRTRGAFGKISARFVQVRKEISCGHAPGVSPCFGREIIVPDYLRKPGRPANAIDVPVNLHFDPDQLLQENIGGLRRKGGPGHCGEYDDAQFPGCNLRGMPANQSGKLHWSLMLISRFKENVNLCSASN
jgi:hypothetical protein